MEAIIRNVRDIEQSERQVLEHVLGRQLRENQQVIIQVVTLGSEQPAAAARSDAQGSSDRLPDWCNVFEGMSEQEKDEVESLIRTRADLSRPSA